MTARDALAAIRERAEAATEGPWWGGGSNRRRDAVGLVGRLSDRGTGNAIAVLAGVGMDRVADAEFIAHARTDVPALVGALEAVLRVADKWERLAEADGEKDPAGWRSHSKAMQIRDAIENALEPR